MNKKLNKTQKSTLGMIILIIIILLLASSVTAYTYFGKIGIFTIERSVRLDEEGSKEVIKNQDLIIDVTDKEKENGKVEINLNDKEYKFSYSIKNIKGNNITCQTSDASIATCYIKDGFVNITMHKKGDFILQITSEEDKKQYISEVPITITDKKDPTQTSNTKDKEKNKEEIENSNKVEDTHNQDNTQDPTNQNVRSYLNSLSVTGFNLNPTFNKNVYEYVVEVEHDTNSVEIQSTSDGVIASGNGTIFLNEKHTIHTIKVKSSDGTMTTYTIKFNKKDYIDTRSSDNNLTNLVVQDFDLTPNFNSNTLEYSLTVSHKVSSLNIYPTLSDSNALVTVDNSSNLVTGLNTVKVTVTAENGDKKIYTIKVTKLAAPNPSDYYLTTLTNYNLIYRESSNTSKNIVLNSNILSGSVTTSINGNKLTLSDEDSEITLISDDVAFEYLENSSNQYSIKLNYTSAGSKTITIKGVKDEVNITSYNITLNITNRYIVTLDGNTGFFTPANNEIELLFTDGDILDLSNHTDAYKESEEACHYFTLASFNTQRDGNGTSYALTDSITINSDLTLYAIYDETNATTNTFTTNTLYLTDVELFLNKDGIKEKIKPGSNGFYVMNIKNTTNSNITLKKLTLTEDNICVENGNYCLNMGYVIKNANESKYYFGTNTTYEIFNSSTISKTYNLNNTYSTTRDISLEDKVLVPNEEIEISILWKWVDDDNDYKIGNYATNNNDIYYLTVSFDYELSNTTCS